MEGLDESKWCEVCDKWQYYNCSKCELLKILGLKEEANNESSSSQ